MVEGGMTCVKYLLFAFNLLFFVIGLILIITGAVIEGSFRQYFEVVGGGEFSAVASLLVAVGIIIFIIGFFGCVGAWKENRCMIKTFAALLIIIFILEIAGAIAGFSLQKNVEEVVKKGLNESLANYDNATATKEAWDDIQTDLHCCGVTSYRDWEGKLGQKLSYPKSCCTNPDSAGCGTTPSLAYQDGCLPNMEAFIKQNLVWVGVVALVVALVQIVGIIFACCLVKAVNAEYDVV